MTGRALPGWSWEENFDAGQRARLAHRIVAELDARLGAVPGLRFYAVTGNPGFSPQLRKLLDEFARGEPGLRRIARQGRSDAYVASEPVLFSRILPPVFEFGPPEIATLVLVEGSAAMQNGLESAIGNAIQKTDGAVGAVCMNFDSGDLVRIG